MRKTSCRAPCSKRERELKYFSLANIAWLNFVPLAGDAS